jgi:hypothetical protein
MIFLTLPVNAQESRYCNDPETSPIPIFIGSGDYDSEAKVNRVSIKEIELAGYVAEPIAELSGLAWYDDNLFLLPQYPDRFASTTYGALFYIPKHEIFSAIDTDTASPLMPESINIHVEDLSGLIPGFEGFESIVFVGQAVYMTIEASSPMRSYIISGTIHPDLSGIFLDTSTLQAIELGGAVPNASDESISYAGGKLLTFYEANGANISQNPVAHVLSENLDPETPISFPNIEYRVTDATKADEEGYFWIINYMYPGDEADYRPSVDTFSEISCVIPDPSGRVERLIELRYTENGIVSTDRTPIDLVLENYDISRNWEGIARLDDRGFILATDRFPKTILAFVQMPVHGCSSFPKSLIPLYLKLISRIWMIRDINSFFNTRNNGDSKTNFYTE